MPGDRPRGARLTASNTPRPRAVNYSQNDGDGSADGPDEEACLLDEIEEDEEEAYHEEDDGDDDERGEEDEKVPEEESRDEEFLEGEGRLEVRSC